MQPLQLLLIHCFFINVDSLTNSQENKCLEAFIPRGLIGSGHAVCGAPVTAEGLCPVRLSWKGGLIASIETIGSIRLLPLNELDPSNEFNPMIRLNPLNPLKPLDRSF